MSLGEDEAPRCVLSAAHDVHLASICAGTTADDSLDSRPAGLPAYLDADIAALGAETDAHLDAAEVKGELLLLLRLAGNRRSDWFGSPQHDETSELVECNPMSP